jgi:hypothetical protein
MEADLQDALIAWQGGDIPAGRTEALLARLQADTEFRQAFAERVWTLSLTKVAQAPEPRWLAVYAELGLARTEEESGETSLEEGVMAAIRRRPLRFVAVWWRRVAVGAIAATILLAIVVGIQQMRQPSPQPAFEREPLAIVVQAKKAVWAPGCSISGEGQAVTTGPLRLQSGQVTLTFLNGTVLQFEGPTNLELLAADRVRCRGGRLRVRGTPGFCIDTPDGSVTDLGTELGVTVTANGKTRVAVFDGKAEASVRAPGQNALRTEILERDQAVELAPANGEIRATTRDGFLAFAELSISPLRVGDEYAKAIQRAKPAHYWRLDRQQQGVIPNEIADGPELRLLGGASIQEDSPGHFCAFFPGRTAPGALLATAPLIRQESGHAVEMWFASQSVGQISLASFKAADDSRGHVALVELSQRLPGNMLQPGIVRYLLRWPPRHEGGMNIFSPPRFLPYQWHHLVAQEGNGQMELFVDGLMVGHARLDFASDHCAAIAQFGTLVALPDRLKNMSRCFAGRMAEIALYDHPLNPDEIREHARLGGVAAWKE